VCFFYISLLLTVPFTWLLADFLSFEVEELKERQGRGAAVGVPFVCGDAEQEQQLRWGLRQGRGAAARRQLRFDFDLEQQQEDRFRFGATSGTTSICRVGSSGYEHSPPFPASRCLEFSSPSLSTGTMWMAFLTIFFKLLRMGGVRW
jgi:hypothetical protein